MMVSNGGSQNRYNMTEKGGGGVVNMQSGCSVGLGGNDSPLQHKKSLLISLLGFN